MVDDEADPPEAQDVQIAANAAVAVAGLVPFLGPVLQGILTTAFMIPMERRKNAWLQDLAIRVQQLEEAGLDLEDLGDDPEFAPWRRRRRQHCSQTSIPSARP